MDNKKMLVAQISPALSMARHNNLFSETVSFVTGSYMAAHAERYTLGSEKVEFTVFFGELSKDFEQNYTKLYPIHRQNVTLTSEDIEQWGTDDSVLLPIIAEKVGTSVVKIMSGEFRIN